MIFHLILNSFLVFIILAALVEFLIFMFRIKNARFRYICRLLPILKFPFDLIIFLTIGESFFLNLNPFSCELEMQEMLAQIIPSNDVLNIQPTIIPQYIANYIPQSVLQTLLITAVTLSAGILVRKLSILVLSQIGVRNLIRTSTLCDREITNKQLRKSLKQSNSLILTSSESQVPFVAGNRYIFIPSNLGKILSQEEFEAVIAHELEHLKWKDPYLRFLSSMICAIFWWIPTAWLIKKLEEDQEEASDVKIYKYGIDPIALGSALVKTVKNAKQLNLELAAICPFTCAKGGYEKRLNNLLNQDHKFQWGACAGTIISLIVFFCFWAC